MMQEDDRRCVPLNARNAHAHNAAITCSTNVSIAINGTRRTLWSWVLIWQRLQLYRYWRIIFPVKIIVSMKNMRAYKKKKKSVKRPHIENYA